MSSPVAATRCVYAQVRAGMWARDGAAPAQAAHFYTSSVASSAASSASGLGDAIGLDTAVVALSAAAAVLQQEMQHQYGDEEEEEEEEDEYDDDDDDGDDKEEEERKRSSKRREAGASRFVTEWLSAFGASRFALGKSLLPADGEEEEEEKDDADK